MNGECDFLRPSNLLEELDRKIMVWLRDGRMLIGILRSVDQFANLVIHQSIERIYVKNQYGDIPRGIFLIRGENVALLGTVDAEKEPVTLEKVSIPDILKAQAALQDTKMEKEKITARAFKMKGLLYTPDDSLLELI